MSTVAQVAMMDADDPFANGLWESLPEEELGYKIATLVMLESEVGCARMYRSINRAFAKAFRPLALCTLPITHPLHSECLVHGVVTIACASVLHEVRVSTSMYTHWYSTVYDGCTQKPPNNLSEPHYQWLSASSVAMIVALGNERLTEEEQRRILVLIRAIFVYLDRFYIKRLGLDTLSVLLTKAINVRNETLGFPPFPLLQERTFVRPVVRAEEGSSETGEDDAVDADAMLIPIAQSAALAAMEVAYAQWEAQHSA